MTRLPDGLPDVIIDAAGAGTVSSVSYGDRGVVSYVIADDGTPRVVKLADAADPYALVAEIDRLDWIGGRLPVPTVLASAPLAVGGHGAVLTLPDGIRVDDPAHRFDGATAAASVQSIGRALRHMHELDISDCPFRAGLDVRLRAIRRRLNAGAYDPALFTKAYRLRDPAEVFALVEGRRPDAEDLVFTHGRLQPSTVFLASDGTVVFGEWAHAGVADRYVDLAWSVAWVGELFGPEQAPSLLEGYGLDRPDLGKLDYFALLGQLRVTLRPLAIVGPTASGKSALALELARRLDAEIVSVDSMQVYRGMDVGTAKPTVAEQLAVRHHLIDLVDPDIEFTVAMFQEAYRAALADIDERGKQALLVGGTGLYHRAVIDDLELPGRFPDVAAELDTEPRTEVLHARLDELDPVAAARMEPTNRRRILRALEVCVGSGRPFSSYGPGMASYPETAVIQVGVDRDRDDLDARIAERYGRQIAAGFVEEVAELAARPAGVSVSARQALGYRELFDVLESGGEVAAAIDAAVLRTRRFARRQQRWFRRDPRVRWLRVAADTESESVADEVLRDWSTSCT